jgi:hypothetical protein
MNRNIIQGILFSALLIDFPIGVSKDVDASGVFRWQLSDAHTHSTGIGQTYADAAHEEAHEVSRASRTAFMSKRQYPDVLAYLTVMSSFRFWFPPACLSRLIILAAQARAEPLAL